MGDRAPFARGREDTVTRQGNITVEGQVTGVLPNGLFRVRLDDGNELLAHMSSSVRLNVVRILPGDRVQVEISPFDLSRGRITRRVGR
jgi:translation initiation factor IF-1